MKLSQIRQFLESTSNLNFILPDGTPIPPHFHITEAGLVTKNFVDCGGTIRKESFISVQIWLGQDTGHRLSASKFLTILNTYQKHFGHEDLPVEFEYQTTTLGRYYPFLGSNGIALIPQTAQCLASDQCGTKSSVSIIEGGLLTLQDSTSTCMPGKGCC